MKMKAVICIVFLQESSKKIKFCYKSFTEGLNNFIKITEFRESILQNFFLCKRNFSRIFALKLGCCNKRKHIFFVF